jgi:hypothetical protein
MSWPSILPQGQAADMRLYEVSQQLRSMQLVQAEQSRRLDEQGYRIHQLEMKDLAGQKLETQRYIWGPGNVGDPSGSRGLNGLGFEVFPSPSKERQVKLERSEKTSVKSMFLENRNAIEEELDSLLFSPTMAPKEPTEETTTEDTSEQVPINVPPCANYFPYVLAVQCSIGGRNELPPTSESELITAQINTSVHASFIDSSLVHHLGVQHKVRNRRPSRFRTSGNPRPRVLLPVFIPVDPSQLSPNSPCAEIQIDFVVVSTHDMPIHEHQKIGSVEIGSQALFIHGIDVLFSSRNLRISNLSIPLSQVAPRDQKRLLSSVALSHGPGPSAQSSWERLRRKTEDTNETWENEPTLLRDKSTNSSISSTSYQPTTAITSPSMTDVDPIKELESELLNPPSPTTGAFASALQFIPSSVVGKPSPQPKAEDLPDTKPQTAEVESKDMSRSQSRTSQLGDEDPIPDREEPLTLPAIPSRKSSLVDFPQPHHSSPRFTSPIDEANEPDLPRLPSTLIDKVVQRKSSSTWPRSLGKKVAPWTSIESTKTTILNPTFEDPIPPPRKMKVLKPARSLRGDNGDQEFNNGEEKGQSQVNATTKNLGGGAFHWIK